MAKGSIEISQIDCGTCGRLTKAERNATVWGVGDLVMVVFTLGLWAVAKLAIGGAPWRCSTCGTK